MKKILTILFICLLQNSFAVIPYYVANHNDDFPTYLNVWKVSTESYTGTNHYIATTGSDANNGTIGSPWKTLHYAATQVTTPGDTIYINSGTYIETLPAMIAVGVSIKGADSATTIIKSHYVADFNFGDPSDAAIAFSSSTEGTNGNQSLSGITLDGDNLTGTLGILVKLRSNVIIHNIKVKDFYINGIGYYGSSVNSETKPTTYSTGNQLYNFTVTNCTDSDATWVGGGNINICGQQNLLIHDFILADTSRSEGRNGDNIINNRFGRGVKIYNGTSYKPSTANAAWNFHFEIPWGCGGAEIYNVNFIGGDCAVDVGGNAVYDEATYPYLFSIHDNYFEDTNPSNNGAHGKTAIAIEGAQVKNVRLYNNTFKNVVQPFGLTDGTSPGVSSHDSNIVIHNNVCINTGVTATPYFQSLVEINKTEAGGSIYGLSIINNTIIPNPTVTATAFTITNYNSSTMKNIVVANNIIERCVNGTWLNVDNTGGTLDSLIVRNNITYNNANSNNLTFTGNAVTNYINSGNIHSDPLLVSSTDYHLQSSSPAIGAAYPYGYGSDIGALQYTTIAPPTISVSGNQPNVTLDHTSVSAVGIPVSGQTITGYTWSKVSGAAVTFGTPNSASTTVTGLTTGTYVLRCTVTQSDGQTAYVEVTITVNIPVPPNAYIKLRLPTKFVNK